MIDIYHFLIYNFRKSVKHMPYERSRQIERRFQRVIDLITHNSMNAKKISTSIHVSQATTHRIITELRNRGYNIRSVRDDHGWCYELVSSPQPGDKGDEK